MAYVYYDVLSDILSGIYSDILWHCIWHSFWHSISHLFWHTFWIFLAYILTVYLAFYLASVLNSFWHLFRHSFWHTIWHLFWHSIWRSVWQSVCHSIWRSIWHIFWLSVWHSIWHSVCHSIWHVFGSRRIPQPPGLAIWSSGPGTLHTILSSRYGCRADIVFESRRDLLHQELAEARGGEGGRGGGERGEEEGGVVPLFKSRDPLAGVGKKHAASSFTEQRTAVPKTSVIKLYCQGNRGAGIKEFKIAWASFSQNSTFCVLQTRTDQWWIHPRWLQNVGGFARIEH